MSPWTSWIGVRYLKSNKSSKFLSFITVVSILGVGIGVTALIVVMSVMDGFEAELKKRLMSSDLHILVTPKSSLSDFDSGFVPDTTLEQVGAEKLLFEDPRVLKVWPVLATEAILRVGEKVTGIVLKGVTSERWDRVKTQLTEEAEEQVLLEESGEGSFQLPGIFIGQELAYMLGLIPGDRVMMVSPTETQGPLEAIPKMKRFVVQGIYSSGLPQEEIHTVFAPSKSVGSFIRRRQVASQWEITVRSFEEAPAVAKALRGVSSDLTVRDWMELNSNLFASLRLERIAMFIILAFIIVVASFNIVTTLTLMVLEKRKEISILKAMGAQKSQVAAVFLAEGIFIGALGVGGGLFLAWILCLFLKNFEFIQLPDIYYDRTLPVTFEPMYYGLVAVSAVIIVIAACLYPSHRASRLHPLEGIRQGG